MRGQLVWTTAILCFWLSAASAQTNDSSSPSTSAVNSFNNSANDSMLASSSGPDITSYAASSSSSSLPATATTSSSVSLSSVSSFLVSDVFSAATSASPPPTQKAPVTNALLTSPDGQSKRPETDPTYIPMIAAIISGFALLVVMVILLLVMAVVYRHINKKEPMMTPLKKPKKADGGLYAIPESQSAQYLVSSMSTPSFGNSPSDVRLDAHIPSSPGNMVYYNRGNDVDHRPVGAAAPYDHEDGYRPIQIVAADVPGRPKSTSKV